jgi:predicted dehydrogenase
MGPGWIAERFTESVQAHTSQIIAAIASRSLDRSEAFAGRHGITAAFGSYEELAAADVDIVYVATPHNFHYEAALMALDAGKHVLVEKPIGINRAQAAGIASRAADGRPVRRRSHVDIFPAQVRRHPTSARLRNARGPYYGLRRIR